MDIEEEIYEQTELFGEFPVIPNYWEKIADEIISETSDTSSVYRQPKGFDEDLADGFI